jgi:T5orf172 domain
MIQKLYSQEQVAKALHRTEPWLSRWLSANPTDEAGTPLYRLLGRNKCFTGDQVVSIIDMILTQEEADKPAPEDGCVYFIDSGDRIKIGYSRSLKARMHKMATDVPGGATLLHLEPGTFRTEKILHRQFAALRERGEWFQKGPELLAYIEQRKAMCR